MRLVATCRDAIGIVAAVAGFSRRLRREHRKLHQHSSIRARHVLLRMQFVVASRRQRRWRSVSARGRRAASRCTGISAEVSDRQRVAILVSRQGHCLDELLWRWRHDELRRNSSSSPQSRSTCGAWSRPPGCPTTISLSSARTSPPPKQLLQTLEGRCDLVVLARYMQVLSSDLSRRLAVPLINIHHSFLPAFAGAGPYERAHARGVKLIGATGSLRHRRVGRGPDHRTGRHPSGSRARHRKPQAARGPHRAQRSGASGAVALPRPRGASPEHRCRLLTRPHDAPCRAGVRRT